MPPSRISPSPLQSPRHSPSWVQRHLPWLYSFWKFSRPHTIIGTTLSVFSLWVIAIASSSNTGLPPSASLLRVLAAWLTCLCGNVYIVGLNQLYDVEIDQMNKPHLPIASGEFSPNIGRIIVFLTGLLALIASLIQGHFLMWTVWISLAIGTAYSLPPIRLKRFPFWASICIFTVRGVIVNIGLFLHFRDGLNQPTIVTPEVWTLTAFILVFTFAIAIFKDIPDLEGDRRYNITTFTVKLGIHTVFKLARWVLTICYGGMILASFSLPSINTGLIVVSHSLAIGLIWLLSRRVNLRQKQSIADFYQFIWKLFFLEYILFPIACLLA
ncbi:MAG: homogentisate phytyltransferase [Cyanobacteria bacterium J06627_8]